MGATDPPEDPELDELARLIASWVTFSMRMTRRNDGLKAMADLGLTFPQIGALHILMFEGAMAVSTLTDKLALSVSATSHLVQRLVEAELVKRVEHEHDRRQKVVSLSDKGRELMGEMMKARLKEFRSSVEHVKPELRHELKDLLQRIVDDLAWRSAEMHTQQQAKSFRGANLEGADLSGQDLAGADFSGANLEGADLSGALATGARFPASNLECADLSGAVLVDARFTGANLKRADLSSARLDGARFESANLEGADLSGAKLANADFTNANLESADLDGADLDGAIFDGANVPAGFGFKNKNREKA